MPRSERETASAGTVVADRRTNRETFAARELESGEYECARQEARAASRRLRQERLESGTYAADTESCATRERVEKVEDSTRVDFRVSSRCVVGCRVDGTGRITGRGFCDKGGDAPVVPPSDAF